MYVRYILNVIVVCTFTYVRTQIICSSFMIFVMMRFFKFYIRILLLWKYYENSIDYKLEFHNFGMMRFKLGYHGNIMEVL